MECEFRKNQYLGLVGALLIRLLMLYSNRGTCKFLWCKKLYPNPNCTSYNFFVECNKSLKLPKIKFIKLHQGD